MNFVRRLTIFVMYAVATSAPCGQGDIENHVSPSVADGVSGQDHHYVISEIVVPTTSSQVVSLGLDIDGDDQVDNVFGQFISAFSQLADQDIQASVAEQVEMGDVIHLLNFRTMDFSSANESALWLFTGDNPSNPPCDGSACGQHLDGSTEFDIVPNAPSIPMTGAVAAGEFTGGPGMFHFDMPLLTGALPLNMIGTRAEVGGDGGSLSGKLGGGITQDELDRNVLPAMAGIFADIIAEDCPGTSEDCGCEPDSTGEILIDLFDDDPADCQITEHEVANSSLVASALQPDLDLLDANGDFNPGQDGVKDSISLGFGIDSVGAEFGLVFVLAVDGFES